MTVVLKKEDFPKVVSVSGAYRDSFDCYCNFQRYKTETKLKHIQERENDKKNIINN